MWVCGYVCEFAFEPVSWLKINKTKVKTQSARPFLLTVVIRNVEGSVIDL